MKKNNIGDQRLYFWKVASVVAAAFMIRVDIYIVNISLPSISRYFGVTTGETAYVTLAYLLFVTSTMLLLGRMGDRFGMRRLLLIGYLLFVVSSFLCGVSTSLLMLVVFRCVQGLGGALLFTSAFGLIPRIVPRKDQGWAYGMWSTACGLGAAVGAPLGGIISGLCSWHWIFLVNVPVGIAGGFLVLRVVPRDRTPSDSAPVRRKNLDLGGAIMSIVGLFALVLALNRGPALGWASPAVLASLAAAAVLLGGMIMWERRHPDPLLPGKLLRDRNLRCAVFAALAGYMILAGNCFLLPFYLELRHGLAPQLSGFTILIYAIVFIFVAPRGGRISDRIDPRRLGAIAMVLLAVAFGGFSLTMRLYDMIPVILFLLWIGVAFGLFFPPTNHLAMRTIARGERGVASGIYQTVANLGMVVGVCLFEVVFSQTNGRIGGSLPANILPRKGAVDFLVPGFRNAYLSGAVIGLLGLCVFSMSLWSGRRREKEETAAGVR